MDNGTCAIWGTPSGLEPRTGDFEIHDSPRAGGRYRISGTAKATISGDIQMRAKLSTWLVDQRLNGIECPNVDSGVLSKVLANINLSTSQRIDRFFLYCVKVNARLGGKIYSYEHKELKGGFIVGHYRSGIEDGEVYAWTESYDWEDFRKLEEVMEANGLLKNAVLTLAGIQRMEELSRQTVDSKQAFVAMWFDPSLNEVYENGIEPAIREAGYEPRIIRSVEHNNKIDDEIIAEIRRSKFVIADFTCGFSEDKQPIARGGVYYEAGFAQGLGLPVIWTCRSDIINHVHFDTRQYNHIVWDTPDDLKIKLLNRIRATIT